jgi:hypothetical protein
MRTSFSKLKFLILLISITVISSSARTQVVTTDTYVFTGGAQNWIVPNCVSSVNVVISGAQGGGVAGGLGATVTGTVLVNPGDVFTIGVGGTPAGKGGGFGGGGTGQGANIPADASAGGGGGSTVLINGVLYSVAGGGGGTGGGTADSPGGAGGCAFGIAGGSPFGQGGSFGTQVAGGAGGPPWIGAGNAGLPGGIGIGGNGAVDPCNNNSPGGGGGGGFFGGGGGGSDCFANAPYGGGSGGGGSSLVPAGGGCNGGVNAGNGTITISYIGGLSAVATNTGGYCEGEMVQLNGLGGVNYAWTGPNGFVSNLQDPMLGGATMAMNGVYQLIVSDPNCPDTDTATTTIVVNEMPSVDPIMDETVCAGSPTTQVDFTGVFGGATYDWTNDNINTGLAANGVGSILPFNGMAALGAVEVSNIVITPSTAFCTGVTENFSITVLPKPLVSVVNDTTICENGTALLVATGSGGGGGPYIYHWDFTANTGPIQMTNPLIPTIYRVFVENAFGCVSASDSINVMMYPPLTGTITGWDTVCPTYSTDITADVMGGLGTPYDFVWSSGPIQNGPDFHTIAVEPGVTTTYTVTITDQCESTPLVLSTDIRVAPVPVPAYTVLDPEQCEPAIFHIVNSTDPTLSQYNYWLFNGDQQFINQDTIVTTEMYAGLYDIQMIITSFEGCVDSLTFDDAVVVDPKPVADFKHSPNPVLMFKTDVLFTNY